MKITSFLHINFLNIDVDSTLYIFWGKFGLIFQINFLLLKMSKFRVLTKIFKIKIASINYVE